MKTVFNPYVLCSLHIICHLSIESEHEHLFISKFSVNSQEAIDNRQKCVIISDIGEKVIFSRNLKKSKDLGVKCLSDGELPMGRRNFFAVTVLHPASYGTENRP